MQPTLQVGHKNVPYICILFNFLNFGIVKYIFLFLRFLKINYLFYFRVYEPFSLTQFIFLKSVFSCEHVLGKITEWPKL